MQCGVDLGSVEGSEGQHGPSTDSRLVAGRSEDRGKAGLVADRPEGGDGGLPHERIGMGLDRGDQAGDGSSAHRTDVGSLTQRPRGNLGDEGVVVGQQGHEVDLRTVAGLGGGAAANGGGGVGEAGSQLFRGEHAEATEGAEGRRPDRGGGVSEERPGQRTVTGVSGHGGLASPLGHIEAVIHVVPWSQGRGPIRQRRRDNDRHMSDSRRFLLLIVSGLLLFAGITVAVVDRTEPAQAVADSPLIVTASAPSTTEASTTTTTAAPEVVAEEPATPRGTVPPNSGRAAISVPKDSYAPEPIIEIGTIEIPKIGLSHKIMHGITLRNIDFGPSHWPGTPLPGEGGNTVFAGHRVTHTHPFRRINELTPGDEIIFTVNGVRSRYVMTGSEIVAPTRIDIINPTAEPTVTLFACHPPGSAKQRYVVRGVLKAADGSPPPPAPAEPSPAPAEG